MSIFEIIGEVINPGPIGKIDFKDDEDNLQKKYISVRFIISLIILAGLEYLLIFQTGQYSDFGYIVKVNSVILIYVLISFKINVKPNTKNIGWVPFLIDNPFKISDDINRLLIVINVLCMPGKYISKSILNFYKSIKINN